MKMIRFVFPLLAAMTLLCAVPARAATISYGPTIFGTYAAGSSGGFTMPSFDTTLGTLTQVDLIVTGYSDGGSNELKNLSANSGDATVSIGTNITITGPASLQVLTFPASSNSGPVDPYSGDPLNFGLSDSIQVFGSPSNDTDNSSIGSGFAAYESVGPGTVPFTYGSTVNTASSASVSPTIAQTSPPTFDFEATIVYHYAIVPEPSSIVLGVLGACGLVVLARRRRRS